MCLDASYLGFQTMFGKKSKVFIGEKSEPDFQELQQLVKIQNKTKNTTLQEAVKFLSPCSPG